jgi:cell division protein FtsW
MNPASEMLGSGYHINQAYIAVGNGGLWGLGFGKSIQKLRYLPEPHTDSIFAIIGEELGFLRAAVVILAYIYLFVLGMRVAKKAPDTFGRLLALGIISSLVIQSLINIAAMLGLVPLTGVTLPFISYGGSSLVISFIQIGILLSISKQANQYVN